MNARMISPWKHPKSSHYWFRMAVPPRYRARIGKTEIKQSLGTSNVREARRLCALHQSEWLARFSRIDAELAIEAERAGIEIVDGFFEREAERNGSLENVIAYELDGIALAESFHLQAADTAADSDNDQLSDHIPYPAYSDAQQRAAIGLRRKSLENDRHTCVLAGAESAQRALSLQFWEVASGFLEEAFVHAGVEIDIDDRRFAIAAEHYLRRLLTHPLPHLDALRDAFPPPPHILPSVPSQSTTPAPQPVIRQPMKESNNVQILSPNSNTPRSRLFPIATSERTISQVFDAWAAEQPVTAKKLCDEWRVAVRRFTELFGDLDVGQIDADMVMDFREAMRRLPTRPKGDVAALPLLEQIERAKADKLPLLSGATVGKLVSGIRVTLGYACDPLRIIRHNPAAGVKVSNAKSEIDARLPFEPGELRVIFADQAMTNPDADTSDSEFWLQLLAPLTGLRLEEMGKLRPSNVKCEDGIWYIAVERDQARKRRAGSAIGEQEKRGKTEKSYRHVPLHWLLIEAGFVEFAKQQLERGCEWLFDDLEADRYGSRTKYISRRLIRRFRDIGIDAEEKVFHSFRHSMKRACRNTPMKEEIADLLAGHAPASVGRKYGAGAALNVLQDAVNMIDYTSIDWDPVIASAKARLLRNTNSTALR